jgi:hypothetical protein
MTAETAAAADERPGSWPRRPSFRDDPAHGTPPDPHLQRDLASAVGPGLEDDGPCVAPPLPGSRTALFPAFDGCQGGAQGPGCGFVGLLTADGPYLHGSAPPLAKKTVLWAGVGRGQDKPKARRRGPHVALPSGRWCPWQGPAVAGLTGGARGANVAQSGERLKRRADGRELSLCEGSA